MQIELSIFKEAFFTRLLPIFQEVTLTAERNFHALGYPQHAVIAGAGALLASLLLYLFGVWISRISAKSSGTAHHIQIEKIRPGATHWLPWLLILSPTPIGTALIIAAGFFRITPWKTAAIILAAEILWRASPYLMKS